MKDIDYRDRLYARYVKARERVLAPDTVNRLAPRAPYLRRIIRLHFPEDRSAKILELGCGHGALLHFARRDGYMHARGVDTSPEQVAAADTLGVDDVEQGDLMQSLLDAADASLDVVVAFDVIEHLSKRELLDLVDQVHRVLRPGGRWIIHVPNGESPMFGRVRYGDFTHELAFTRESIAQLLLASGFSTVRCLEDTPVVHGAKSAIRWLIWKAMRAVLRLYVAAETGDSGKSAVFSQNLLAVATKT